MLNSKINFRRMTEARYEHGLSVSELSIITGLTEKQIMELESGKNEKSFVEHEHRIDCVKRVAEALGINYDQFLSVTEYRVVDPETSSFKENERKSNEGESITEFNELRQEIAKFRINELDGSEYSDVDRTIGKKIIKGNLRSAELFGPSVLILLYLFFYLLNFI